MFGDGCERNDCDSTSSRSFRSSFNGPFDYGIIRRGREKGLIETRVHDLRDFTSDRHHTVDDRPFGGGEGMVFKPEPIFKAVETVRTSDAGAKWLC